MKERRATAERWFTGGLAAALFSCWAIPASAQNAPEPPGGQTAGAVVQVTSGTQAVAVVSDRVTLNVVNGSIAEVLSAFSRQTGRNVVLGPTVTNLVNVRLNDTPWTEALDVLLQPYGLGYRLVGKTIVVNQLSELRTFETVEPLASRVFTLGDLTIFWRPGAGRWGLPASAS